MKKNIFHVSDSTFVIKKIINVKKWEKVSFNGLFELTIVNLVGIELLNVNIEGKLRKLGFFLFSPSLVLT